MNETKGIVVIGLPRSGTTLLRRILNSHSRLCCPGETNILNACARFLRSPPFANVLPIGVVTGLSFLGFEEETVYGRLREFAFSFLNEHCINARKVRWVEKSPLDVFYLEKIEEFLGNEVKYICLHRHALDVAISTQEFCDKAGGYLPELHEYIRRFHQPLEAFSQMWSEKTDAILRFAERRRQYAISLRYEDVVAQPRVEIGKILTYLEEPWEDAILRFASTDESLGLGDWKTYGKSEIVQSSVERWRHLPLPMLQLLAPIVNATLQRCGYDCVNVEFDPDEPRRRYELGLMVQAMRSTEKGP